MDTDIVFTIGVLFRIVLINTVLLPVSALGLSARCRWRGRAKSTRAGDEIEDVSKGA